MYEMASVSNVGTEMKDGPQGLWGFLESLSPYRQTFAYKWAVLRCFHVSEGTENVTLIR